MITTYILSLYSFLQAVINKGQVRSVKAKQNIIFSFLIKSVSIAISFIMVPITINYINPNQYGIWLTLSSIVGWFSFFDIGLSHGLRNKFSEARAKSDYHSAQIYVSTTYAILGIIFFTVWLLFIVVNQFLNWSDILKIPQNMQSEISILAIIIFTYFCLQFILRLITTIIIADQEPAKVSLIDLIGQIISLLAIVLLIQNIKGSLIVLVLALCISPILALIGANIYLFRGKYKLYKPAYSKIRLSFAKSLFNLGLTFFVIQISVIIQFESANIIIARNFGTSEVTSYNIVYKYFNMINMLNIIFLTPFWSAATEAFFKNDLRWIRAGIKRYSYLNIILLVISTVMLIFSNDIYALWLGQNKIDIDFSLSLWGYIFINFYVFGSKYVFFLNGISALRLQLWLSIITPFIYIITALVLIDYYRVGVFALFIAAILANANGIIMAPLQYYQIIYRRKKGIWIQ